MPYSRILTPWLPTLPLGWSSPRAVVREWYAAAMQGGGVRTSVMQSYSFLRASFPSCSSALRR
jgi:hypothetical protein